jgi:hypothetical protein
MKPVTTSGDDPENCISIATCWSKDRIRCPGADPVMDSRSAPASSPCRGRRGHLFGTVRTPVAEAVGIRDTSGPPQSPTGTGGADAQRFRGCGVLIGVCATAHAGATFGSAQ